MRQYLLHVRSCLFVSPFLLSLPRQTPKLGEIVTMVEGRMMIGHWRVFTRESFPAFVFESFSIKFTLSRTTWIPNSPEIMSSVLDLLSREQRNPEFHVKYSSRPTQKLRSHVEGKITKEINWMKMWKMLVMENVLAKVAFLMDVSAKTRRHAGVTQWCLVLGSGKRDSLMHKKIPRLEAEKYLKD